MDLLVGVVGSVLATILVVLAGWSWRGFNRRRKLVRAQAGILDRLGKAGVSNFYASRIDYTLHRGAPRLTDYLGTASKSIKVAAYWMAQGHEAEGIARSIGDMVERRPELEITLALIDPTSDYLGALADYLGVPPTELRTRLKASLTNLAATRESLGDRSRGRFRLKVYRSLPVASVIMLDSDTESGRIQLDFKP